MSHPKGGRLISRGQVHPISLSIPAASEHALAPTADGHCRPQPLHLARGPSPLRARLAQSPPPMGRLLRPRPGACPAHPRRPRHTAQPRTPRHNSPPGPHRQATSVQRRLPPRSGVRRVGRPALHILRSASRVAWRFTSRITRHPGSLMPTSSAGPRTRGRPGRGTGALAATQAEPSVGR